jgi:hypothetical protein
MLTNPKGPVRKNATMVNYIPLPLLPYFFLFFSEKKIVWGYYIYIKKRKKVGKTLAQNRRRWNWSKGPVRRGL